MARFTSSIGSLACALALAAGCTAEAARTLCGACDEGLECHTVGAPTPLLSPAVAVDVCARACAFDRDCAELGSSAYCAHADLCLHPCASDAECAEGTRCVSGVCAVARSPSPRIDPFVREPGSRLALGARVVWVPPSTPCRALMASSEPPGVVDVGVLEVFESSPGSCSARVEIVARGEGRADLILASVRGPEVLRRTLDVERASELSIGRWDLLGGATLPVDVPRIGEPGGLTVIARDAEGARLAVGGGADWAIEPPSVGLVEPLDEAALEAGLAVVDRAEGGSATLRVELGSVSHEIPVEL